MHRATLLRLAALALLLFPLAAAAQPAPVRQALDKGAAWLAANRNDMGGWGGDDPASDTALAAQALALARPDSRALAPALAWLRGRPAHDHAGAARAVAALAAARAPAGDLGAALLAGQNAALDQPPAAPAIFADSFSRDTKLWEPSSAVNCQAAYAGGAFQLAVSANAFGPDCWYTGPGVYSDVDVELDARSADDKPKHYGIAFRRQRDSGPAISPYGRDDRLYRFEVNPATGQYALFLQNGRETTALIGWTTAASIAKGQATNRLRVIALGPQITLFANGRRLAAVSDATLSGGQIGMLAVGGAENVSLATTAFDNLTVYRTRAFAALRPGGDDGGWGVGPGYSADPWHTALALYGLGRAGGSQAARAQAARYLIAAQQADGGWALTPGGPSSVAVTAQATLALAATAWAPGAPEAIARGAQLLRALQRADGGWGSVAETALALRALRGRGLSAQAAGAAQSFLLSRQAADGSWNASPRDTAHALLALAGEPAFVETWKVYLPHLRRG